MSRLPVGAAPPIYRGGVRLAKYLAHAGVASRRDAERLIAAGRVRVDGAGRDRPGPRRHGRQRGDRGRPHRSGPSRSSTTCVNKPIGVVSTAHDPGGRPKVTDLVDTSARLYPVGRLDADSSGLIILTNDGELANRLMHPRYEVEKRYRVRVQGSPSKAALASLRQGVELDDGKTAPAQVRVLDTGGPESVLELAIHEGRKRKVRRMCEAVGHPVIALERTGIGPLELGRLHVGRVAAPATRGDRPPAGPQPRCNNPAS